MNLGGGDRRRIDILQGRNRLKGAQNNILRLKGSSLISLWDDGRPIKGGCAMLANKSAA